MCTVLPTETCMHACLQLVIVGSMRAACTTLSVCQARTTSSSCPMRDTQPPRPAGCPGFRRGSSGSRSCNGSSSRGPRPKPRHHRTLLEARPRLRRPQAGSFQPGALSFGLHTDRSPGVPHARGHRPLAGGWAQGQGRAMLVWTAADDEMHAAQIRQRPWMGEVLAVPSFNDDSTSRYGSRHLVSSHGVCGQGPDYNGCMCM